MEEDRGSRYLFHGHVNAYENLSTVDNLVNIAVSTTLLLEQLVVSGYSSALVIRTHPEHTRR